MGDVGSDDEDSEETPWPPKAPVVRFKGVAQFMKPFSSDASAQHLQEHNEKVKAAREAMGNQDAPLQNYMVYWLNQTFQLNLETNLQFDTGFPTILLFILDAVYRNKVPWTLVNWNLQYKRSTQRNYVLVQKIWGQLNMDRAQGFRATQTHLAIHSIPTASIEEKLEFTMLMKKWFDARIHGVGQYDAMARRREFVHTCQKRGHTVEFPSWVLYKDEPPPRDDDDDDAGRSVLAAKAQKAYDAMPEFKRLIWFLGSSEHQHM